MKKIPFFLAAVILLLPLAGCRSVDENSYNFYYVRSSDTILFGQSDALIAPLQRQISGQSSELSYLMQLYFEGPTEEGFQSPFPQGTRLILARLDGEILFLEVTTHFTGLENIGLTLAGACLTSTCHELAGVETVLVISGEESYQFYRNDYTFWDVIDPQSGKDNQ